MPTKPVEKGVITCGYGERINPITKEKEFHYGIDIGVPGNLTNAKVICAKEGKVSWIENDTAKSFGFGKVVAVLLSDGFHCFYPHLSEINPSLKYGQKLKEGDYIGIMGSTGMSTAVHLHYQERDSLSSKGKSREPKDIIALF